MPSADIFDVPNLPLEGESAGDLQSRFCFGFPALTDAVAKNEEEDSYVMLLLLISDNDASERAGSSSRKAFIAASSSVTSTDDGEPTEFDITLLSFSFSDLYRRSFFLDTESIYLSPSFDPALWKVSEGEVSGSSSWKVCLLGVKDRAFFDLDALLAKALSTAQLLSLVLTTLTLMGVLRGIFFFLFDPGVDETSIPLGIWFISVKVPNPVGSSCVRSILPGESAALLGVFFN